MTTFNRSLSESFNPLSKVPFIIFLPFGTELERLLLWFNFWYSFLAGMHSFGILSSVSLELLELLLYLLARRSALMSRSLMSVLLRVNIRELFFVLTDMSLGFAEGIVIYIPLHSLDIVMHMKQSSHTRVVWLRNYLSTLILLYSARLKFG